MLNLVWGYLSPIRSDYFLKYCNIHINCGCYFQLSSHNTKLAEAEDKAKEAQDSLASYKVRISVFLSANQEHMAN